jgi:hypothetical protein
MRKELVNKSKKLKKKEKNDKLVKEDSSKLNMISGKTEQNSDIYVSRKAANWKEKMEEDLSAWRTRNLARKSFYNRCKLNRGKRMNFLDHIIKSQVEDCQRDFGFGTITTNHKYGNASELFRIEGMKVDDEWSNYVSKNSPIELGTFLVDALE